MCSKMGFNKDANFFCFKGVRAIVDNKNKKNVSLKVYLSLRHQKSVALGTIV